MQPVGKEARWWEKQPLIILKKKGSRVRVPVEPWEGSGLPVARDRGQSSETVPKCGDLMKDLFKEQLHPSPHRHVHSSTENNTRTHQPDLYPRAPRKRNELEFLWHRSCPRAKLPQFGKLEVTQQPACHYTLLSKDEQPPRIKESISKIKNTFAF